VRSIAERRGPLGRSERSEPSHSAVRPSFAAHDTINRALGNRVTSIYRLRGGSPNCSRSRLTAISSAVVQSTWTVWLAPPYDEEITSLYVAVCTASVGRLRSVLSKSVLAVPRSHPRGVRCHSVHSLLAGIPAQFDGQGGAPVRLFGHTCLARSCRSGSQRLRI
jgi:hypothetical protein